MLYLKLPSLQDTLWCWKDILYVGLPAAGSSTINPISIGVITSLLAGFGAFNALGKPIPSVVMTVARMFVLYIPLAYFGGKLYGVNRIFGAACISNLIVGIGAYVWNQKTCTGKAIDSAEVVSN